MKEIFNKDKISFRTFIILFIAIVFYSSVILYLFYLQIIKGNFFFHLSKNNHCKVRWLFSPRGEILDRNGNQLVINQLRFRVVLVNKKYKNLSILLEELINNLHLDRDSLLRKINQNYFSVIHIFHTIEEVNHWQVNDNIHDNFIVEECWVRKNLYTSLNHLTGYVKYDQLVEIPIRGLEKTYNYMLEGKKVQHSIFVDTHKNIININRDHNYKKGKNLTTTICLEGQKEGERLMKGVKGGLLVLNGKGEVLVHFSSPYLEVYENMHIANNYFLNKILQERYAPGSIFKIISALVLLRVGFKPVLCTGSVMIGNRIFHCWKRAGHGSIENVVSALQYSCNVFFYTNSGVHPEYLEIFTNYLKEFGFGEKTQEELQEEIRSVIAIKNQRTQILMASIGQGSTVSTIIQNALLIHGVMNGKKITPKFTCQLHTKEQKIEIPEEHLEIVRNGLGKNFESGTCAKLAIPGIKLYGKTSTSQVMSLGAKNYKKENSIFICAAPEYDLYVSVLGENCGFGSAFAGKIGVQILKYLANLQNTKKKIE